MQRVYLCRAFRGIVTPDRVQKIKLSYRKQVLKMEGKVPARMGMVEGLIKQLENTSVEKGAKN